MRASNRMKCIVPYLLPAAVCVLLLGLNLFAYDNWLDSDMAAEMIFSRLLADEGHFFATPDWYYSTEFRFLYTHWLMVPLFWITDNWHVIRMVTNLISYVLVLASYAYFMKPLGVKRELVAASSAILLLPFSETMMTHMAMGNTYLFHVIIVFWFFGLYLRLVGVGQMKESVGTGAGERTGRLRRIVRIVLFTALALVCGVSGVRYLLALQCPLVLAAFVYCLKSEEFQTLRQTFGEKDGSARTAWRAVLTSRSVRYFGWGLAGLLGAIVGYGINVLYVSRAYVFQTYGATNFIAVYQGVLTERLQNAIGCLLMLFGYIPDKGVLSLRGLVTIAAFVMLAIFAYAAYRVLHGVHGEDASRGERYFIALFLAVSFALNFFVFVFTTSTMVPRYYITTWIFAVAVLCFYLEQREPRLDRTVVAVILTACLLLATAKTTLSYLTVDKNETKRPVAEFLTENGYTFGYATYNNANIITELTNGAVEIANISGPDTLTYFKWSSPARYYEDGYAEGVVFLLLTADEAAEYADAASVQAGEIVYDDGNYIVLTYESADALFATAE